MNSLNHVTIHGWMCNELELKGNELLVFALIYGFSQDGETRFYGSRNYIAKTFNISLPTVDKALNSLEEKNLIERTNVSDAKSGMHNEYNVCKETLLWVVKKLYRGSKEILHNNTSNINNKKESNTKVLLQNSEKPKKKNLYEKCLDSIYTFTQDVQLREELITFLKLRLEMARDEGKSFYYGMWTHLLGELRQLAFKDNVLDTKLALEIVRKSTCKGWKHFYAITSNDYDRNRRFASDNLHDKINESGITNVPHITEEEERELERMIESGELQEY